MSQVDIKSQLLPKAMAGDVPSLEKLILQCYPDVSSFARKVCANPQDAEDATQYTLSVLWKQLPKFRQEAKLTTWLYVVVKNECLRLKNKLMQHQSTAHESYQSLEQESDAQAKEYLLSLLGQLISEMDADDRSLIVLHEIEGTGLQQIADQWKMPLNTVKTRIRRARLRLKEKLEATLSQPET